MPSLLLTNYDKEFENKMFHSIYDSAAFHEYNNTLGSSQPVVRHNEISNTFYSILRKTFSKYEIDRLPCSQVSRLASVAEMVADAVISLASEVLLDFL